MYMLDFNANSRNIKLQFYAPFQTGSDHNFAEKVEVNQLCQSITDLQEQNQHPRENSLLKQFVNLDKYGHLPLQMNGDPQGLKQLINNLV